VTTAAQWIQSTADEQQRQSIDVLLALLGMAMTYTVVAMVNAVVLAAADRRAEFATARVSGLTRGQVVAMALAESVAVIVIGLFLGGLAAAATVLGISTAIDNMTGIHVMVVPWPPLGTVALGATVLVGATSALTSLAATRTPAIRLVGGRE
jgi:putative ABC transport system permease protein